MTTDTAPQVAHQAQTNVIKALSQAIWGSEWIILDEYGDSDGKLDRELAVKLIDALHDVRRLPVDRLSDEEKLAALTSALAGESLDEFAAQFLIQSDIPAETIPPDVTPNPQPLVEAGPQPVVEAPPEPTVKAFTSPRHSQGLQMARGQR